MLICTYITVDDSIYCYSLKYGGVAGDVTIYAMNLNKLSSVNLSIDIQYSYVLAYNMEPTDGTLTSPDVNVNGKTMRLVNDKLPVISPLKTNIITLKPLTFGLFVLSGANAAACRQ